MPVVNIVPVFMVVRFGPICKRRANAAFTLVEVVMAIAILALVMAGMIYGYVQTNYRAEWGSMSLDAQSFASEAVEQVRAASWSMNVQTVNGQTATNQLQLLPLSYTVTNTMLIPGSGQLTNVLTTVSISTNIYSNDNPPVRQFIANCVWYFPRETNAYTNTVVTWRAPDR